MNQEEIARAIEEFAAARRKGEYFPRAWHDRLSLDDAYRIQLGLIKRDAPIPLDGGSAGRLGSHPAPFKSNSARTSPCSAASSPRGSLSPGIFSAPTSSPQGLKTKSASPSRATSHRKPMRPPSRLLSARSSRRSRLSRHAASSRAGWPSRWPTMPSKKPLCWGQQSPPIASCYSSALGAAPARDEAEGGAQEPRMMSSASTVIRRGGPFRSPSSRSSSSSAATRPSLT
jgi:hypothetical protein